MKSLVQLGEEWAKHGSSKRVPQWVDKLPNHEFELFMQGAEKVWGEA